MTERVAIAKPSCSAFARPDARWAIDFGLDAVCPCSILERVWSEEDLK